MSLLLLIICAWLPFWPLPPVFTFAYPCYGLTPLETSNISWRTILVFHRQIREVGFWLEGKAGYLLLNLLVCLHISLSWDRLLFSFHFISEGYFCFLRLSCLQWLWSEDRCLRLMVMVSTLTWRASWFLCALCLLKWITTNGVPVAMLLTGRPYSWFLLVTVTTCHYLLLGTQSVTSAGCSLVTKMTVQIVELEWFRSFTKIAQIYSVHSFQKARVSAYSEVWFFISGVLPFKDRSCRTRHDWTAACWKRPEHWRLLFCCRLDKGTTNTPDQPHFRKNVCSVVCNSMQFNLGEFTTLLYDFGRTSSVAVLPGHNYTYIGRSL